MTLNLDLKYVEKMARENLDAYSLKKIEASLDAYLEEATKENIAKTIGSIYQGIRKNYRLKKSTTNGEEFWREIAKFWHYADTAYYTHYFHINGGMPFNYRRAEEVSTRILKSIYGDIFTAYNIAEHETLGGLHAVVEAMIKKMEKTAEESFISCLIYKYFGKYKKNSSTIQYFWAIQYLAVKYLMKYRPDLQASQFKRYMLCYDDTSEMSHSKTGLHAILTLHLKDEFSC